MNSKLMVAVAVAAVAVTLTASETAWARPDASQAAAIADRTRPKADTDRDGLQRAAEMLEFAGVKRGRVVADVMPGGGYWTRLFSKTVGPKGKVYALFARPPANTPADPPPADVRANVVVVEANFEALQLPEKVDVFWVSRGFRDFYRDGRDGRDAPKAVSTAIYANLRPGGVFIVLDHAASAGAPLAEQIKLRRIDPALVKADVTAAGFRYEGESKVLANPADDHSKPISDPSIAGHTDQFVYRFRKPG